MENPVVPGTPGTHGARAGRGMVDVENTQPAGIPPTDLPDLIRYPRWGGDERSTPYHNTRPRIRSL